MRLLHRPSFEQDMYQGRHLLDESFAEVLLMVCAIGSRYTSDPRVLIPGHDTVQGNGWIYFRQVTAQKSNIGLPATVLEIQFLCVGRGHDSDMGYALTLRPQLVSAFLHFTSIAHGSWKIVGMAVRGAQEIGLHRRKHDKPPSAETEIEKRTWWLVFLETYLDIES